MVSERNDKAIWFVDERQLVCLTERVLLASIGSELPYVAGVPWTYIMVSS
jgi:hypothetical protein